MVERSIIGCSYWAAFTETSLSLEASVRTTSGKASLVTEIDNAVRRVGLVQHDQRG